MGGRWIRDLMARVGREYCIKRGGARLNSEGKKAREVRGGSHSVGRCGIFRRSRDAAPEVRAAKSFESREAD